MTGVASSVRERGPLESSNAGSSLPEASELWKENDDSRDPDICSRNSNLLRMSVIGDRDKGRQARNEGRPGAAASWQR